MPNCIVWGKERSCKVVLLEFQIPFSLTSSFSYTLSPQIPDAFKVPSWLSARAAHPCMLSVRFYMDDRLHLDVIVQVNCGRCFRTKQVPRSPPRFSLPT